MREFWETKSHTEARWTSGAGEMYVVLSTRMIAFPAEFTYASPLDMASSRSK
jgi:hypothetical protein